MKTILLIGTFLLLGTFATNYKTLHLNYFTIEVPNNWRYIPQQGVDSFAGEIRGPKVKLSFDCSGMGYASNLIQSPEDFINRQLIIYSNLFNEPSVIYTTKENVEAVRMEEMKKLNASDTSLVKVRPFIKPFTKIYQPANKDLEKYKDADYLIDLTYQGKTKTVGVTLPAEIKKHNVKIDTANGFIVKTIWPKKVGDGMTGVYYRKIGSAFDLQINGNNLREQQQAEILKAFRTIKIKK